MVVLVPDAGMFQQFESALTGEQVSGILKDLQSRRVLLTVPKFTYESRFSLAKTLGSLGMADAITPGKADFSGMTNNREIYIGDVVHRAIVAVNEKGTEAAAATAVIGVASAARPTNEVTLVVDRPFVFLIRDVETGTIVFLGRVLNPAR